jgi:hypothetical protein
MVPILPQPSTAIFFSALVCEDFLVWTSVSEPLIVNVPFIVVRKNKTRCHGQRAGHDCLLALSDHFTLLPVENHTRERVRRMRLIGRPGEHNGTIAQIPRGNNHEIPRRPGYF